MRSRARSSSPLGKAKPVIDINRLADATGRSTAALVLAIPDLDDPRRVNRSRQDGPPPGYLPASRRGCHHCVARRLGTQDPIDHWVTLTSRVCAFHRRWLGVNSFGTQQPLLEGAPDILQAHRRHMKLNQRYGHNEVAAAYWEAERVVQRWCQRGTYRNHRDRRLTELGEEARSLTYTNAAFEAACYPDVIGLTSVFVSPSLIERGLTVHNGHPHHLYAEVGRRIGYPDFQPYGAYDPFVQWLSRLSRQPAINATRRDVRAFLQARRAHADQVK